MVHLIRQVAQMVALEVLVAAVKLTELVAQLHQVKATLVVLVYGVVDCQVAAAAVLVQPELLAQQIHLAMVEMALQTH